MKERWAFLLPVPNTGSSGQRLGLDTANPVKSSGQANIAYVSTSPTHRSTTSRSRAMAICQKCAIIEKSLAGPAAGGEPK